MWPFNYKVEIRSDGVTAGFPLFSGPYDEEDDENSSIETTDVVPDAIIEKAKP